MPKNCRFSSQGQDLDLQGQDQGHKNLALWTASLVRVQLHYRWCVCPSHAGNTRRIVHFTIR